MYKTKNNRRKTRELIRKKGDIKGTFCPKIGKIKDRNGIDLTETDDIKKTWQEYTEELYNKGLHDLDNHDGVITYLELDILGHEVKWDLEPLLQTELVEVTEFQLSYLKS